MKTAKYLRIFGSSEEVNSGCVGTAIWTFLRLGIICCYIS